MMAMYSNAGRGTEKLWRVFWLLGALVFVVYFKLTGFVDSNLTPSIKASPFYSGVWFWGIPFVYSIYWCGLVFKCCENSSTKLCGVVANIFSMLTVLGLAVMFLFAVALKPFYEVLRAFGHKEGVLGFLGEVDIA